MLSFVNKKIFFKIFLVFGEASFKRYLTLIYLYNTISLEMVPKMNFPYLPLFPVGGRKKMITPKVSPCN